MGITMLQAPSFEATCDFEGCKAHAIHPCELSLIDMCLKAGWTREGNKLYGEKHTIAMYGKQSSLANRKRAEKRRKEKFGY